MTDAFDADALIYASIPGHALGRRVYALFADAPAEATVGVGSELLRPEVLIRPSRRGDVHEAGLLGLLLAHLDLRPVDRDTSLLAVSIGARFGLRAPDAIHLATAVLAGADRFITNNTKDFAGIDEVEIVTPADLPDPAR